MEIIRKKKIEAATAIIAVVLTLVVIGSVPTIIADPKDEPVYDGTVTVTLTATDVTSDPYDIESGVKATYYLVLTGLSPSTPGYDDVTEQYNGPFDVSTPGHHVVYFYSEDNAGNREAIKSVSFYIYETPPDTIPPVTNCTLEGTSYQGPTPTP